MNFLGVNILIFNLIIFKKIYIVWLVFTCFFVGENSLELENNHSQEFNHINLNEPPFESKIMFLKSRFFKNN